MNIRTATLDDLQAVTAVEAACFPAAEAASEERMRDRISHFGDHFWLLFDDDGTLISFVDGMVTGKGDLTDDLYADASLHDEKGAWQMIIWRQYTAKLSEARLRWKPPPESDRRRPQRRPPGSSLNLQGKALALLC